MREMTNTRTIVDAFSMGNLFNVWSRNQAWGLLPLEKVFIGRYCTDQNAKILNIGCGSGRETFALYNLGFRNVRGTDCTAALLESAREYAQKEAIAVEFTLAQADELPYPSESFAIITLSENVYGHITPRAARIGALREIRRVLKPGGYVYMNITAISHKYRHVMLIRLGELLRCFYNPNKMERGDKVFGQAQIPPDASVSSHVPRTHWFRYNEVFEEAHEADLHVVRATTEKMFLKNPDVDSSRTHNAGRLVFILQRSL